MLSSTTTITAAQFLALNGSPVLLQAAGGGTTDLVPVFALVKFTAGGTAFTAGGFVGIQYGNSSSGTYITNEIPATGFKGASTDFVLMPLVASTAYTAIENTGLYLASTGNFATGNGTAVVTLFYVVQ